MLSSPSIYSVIVFLSHFQENPCQHPVFFLKDTTYVDLKAVIEFVYNGEVNVTQGQLSSFLKTAEMLQVRGLTGDDEKVRSSSWDYQNNISLLVIFGCVFNMKVTPCLQTRYATIVQCNIANHATFIPSDLLSQITQCNSHFVPE